MKRAWAGLKRVVGLGSPRVSDAAKLDQTLAELSQIQRAAAKRPQGAPSPPAADAPDISKMTIAQIQAAKVEGHILGRFAKEAYAAGDIKRASQLWVLGASKGHVESIFNVGLCSAEGVGVITQDFDRAIQLLEPLAVKLRIPWAQYALATVHMRKLMPVENRTRVPFYDVSKIPLESRRSSSATAAFHLTLAAATGNVPPAYLNLAHCYAEGIGTDIDDGAALRWAEVGASRGDPQAAIELSVRYKAAGKAIEAWRALRTAAEANHPIAMHNVGVGYLLGHQLDGLKGAKGAKPDPKAALIWFTRAAESGWLKSLINVGLLLEGTLAGLDQDLVKAQGVYKELIEKLPKTTQVSSGEREVLLKHCLDRLSLINDVLEGKVPQLPKDSPSIQLDAGFEENGKEKSLLETASKQQGLDVDAATAAARGGGFWKFALKTLWKTPPPSSNDNEQK